MRRLLALGTLLLTAPAVPTASAQTILDFEGITTGTAAQIGGFYSGQGITFEDNALALCLNTLTRFCSNTSRGGLGDPTSAYYGMFFESGNTTTMNVAGGFDTGFSFYYASIVFGAGFGIYSGLDGSGSLLAGGSLPLTPSDCPVGYVAGFCPFGAFGVLFAGTAQSVIFSSDFQGGFIVFDDITLGSDVPGRQDVVPEPATMTLLATGLAGMAAARKKRKA